MESIEPPADPNDWSDDQWIEWLKATDADTSDENVSVAWSVGSRIINSPTGQMLGQAMLGMSQAIYGRRDDEVVIVVDANGEKSDEEVFDVRLDSSRPSQSQVVFKATSKPKR